MLSFLFDVLERGSLSIYPIQTQQTLLSMQDDGCHWGFFHSAAMRTTVWNPNFSMGVRNPLLKIPVDQAHPIIMGPGCYQ
jgi:hypothetical protein